MPSKFHWFLWVGKAGGTEKDTDFVGAFGGCHRLGFVSRARCVPCVRGAHGARVWPATKCLLSLDLSFCCFDQCKERALAVSCLANSIGFCGSERLVVQKRTQISLVHLVGVIGWGSCVIVCGGAGAAPVRAPSPAPKSGP